MRNVFYSLIIVFAFFGGCRPNVEFNLLADSLMVGLASPIQLNPDTTLVVVSDYFPTVPTFDSVTATQGIKVSINDSVIQLVVFGAGLPSTGTISFYVGNDQYDILLKRSDIIESEFIFKPKQQYKTVQLKGEFNAWNAEATYLTREQGIWKAILKVEPGAYQYLIVADGHEMLDPHNFDSISNNMGGYNSLMKVGLYENLEQPHLTITSAAHASLKVAVSNFYDDLLVFANNTLLPFNFVRSDRNEIEILIPEQLNSTERSYIRVQASNDHGLSNFLLIPIHYGKVLNHVSQLKRTDFEAATIYNVFTDRFFDGNPDNTWKIDDKSILRKANYFGGDIEGIIQKIEGGYFKELGINTIWVSPLVKNPESAFGKYPNPKTTFSAYHGYWPISFTQLNPHFGTPADLKKMVEVAHNNDMNVLLDFVANHVHEEHPVIKAHPDWKTDLYLPDGSLNTERWESHRLTTWFDTFLPTLDLSKVEVTEMLTDSAVYWIKEYNLDGFRHDATKHIPEYFWRTLTRKLRVQVSIPENRRLYQLGETYGSPQLISSYVNSGQLDAQFDFNMYDAIVGVLAGDRGFGDLASEIQKSLKYYGSNHLMGNITGNQDRARFISYASGALRFDEDAKKAGWTREIKVEDSVGYTKAAMLNAVVSTLPGIPVIYYGDEIGMPGGNDPDNRRMMRFDSLSIDEQNLKNITKILFNFRRKALPLIFGDFCVVYVSPDVMVYQRSYLSETVLVAFNKSMNSTQITSEVPLNFESKKAFALFGNSYNITKQQVSIELPPFGFEIITNVKL